MLWEYELQASFSMDYLFYFCGSTCTVGSSKMMILFCTRVKHYLINCRSPTLIFYRVLEIFLQAVSVGLHLTPATNLHPEIAPQDQDSSSATIKRVLKRTGHWSRADTHRLASWWLIFFGMIDKYVVTTSVRLTLACVKVFLHQKIFRHPASCNTDPCSSFDLDIYISLVSST